MQSIISSIRSFYKNKRSAHLIYPYFSFSISCCEIAMAASKSTEKVAKKRSELFASHEKQTTYFNAMSVGQFIDKYSQVCIINCLLNSICTNF